VLLVWLECLTLALAVLGYPLGLLAGAWWLLPLLNAVPAYLAMVLLLRRGERSRAVRLMLLWAAALAVFGTLSFRAWPDRAAAVVVHGEAYRDQMFGWIRTGAGQENHPSLFLPLHLRDLGAFVVLSLLTASSLSILMGTLLMNYMDFYVASLSVAGVPGRDVLLFGWQPYALCRVAAFSVLGAVLAEPLLARLKPYPYPGLAAARPYLLWAAFGILADWTVKTAIAPTWGLHLRGVLP
jgi:hypothetical protein